MPLGVYRHRLITTTADGIDGVVQFAKWQDIPEEMALFVSQLKVTIGVLRWFSLSFHVVIK